MGSRICPEFGESRMDGIFRTSPSITVRLRFTRGPQHRLRSAPMRLGRDDHHSTAFHTAYPTACSRNSPFKLVQTPAVVVVLYEEFNHYRQIFTDGRGFPAEMSSSWFGYSVGKWEGDVFVAETAGFNDKSWLDDPGRPHTDALRVTERFRRTNFGRMEMQITFDDPKAYTKPWIATIPFTLLPDTELIESICENERDHGHIVGK
jgi:hypothetical protein